MRRLLLIVVIPIALLVVADYGVRLYSQSVVGGELRSALDLSKKPSVSLGGWPFTLHLFSGDLPSASFTVDSFQADGYPLRRVTVDLEDVRFPSERLISGGGGTIRAARGHGSAALTGADVTAALREKGIPLTVTIADDRASVRTAGLTVGLGVELSGSSLVLTPAAVSVASAHISLPTILTGLTYTGVELRGSEAVVSFRLHRQVFVIR